jgi:hypothetical protein
VPLIYGPEAPPIWLVTNGLVSVIAGVVLQGKDSCTACIAMFLAKLNPVQTNYPVHEMEMLAGVESMCHHRDILLGCFFTWVTDHKSLMHLLQQKNLLVQQACWIERISEFYFCVEYIPEPLNVLLDALLQLYANDLPGTVQAASKFTMYDNDEDLPLQLAAFSSTLPVLAGSEGAIEQCQAPVRMTCLHWAGLSPAETGRPKTSKEFACCIWQLVVHGPCSQPAESGTVGNNNIPDRTVSEQAPVVANGNTHPVIQLASTPPVSSDGNSSPVVIEPVSADEVTLPDTWCTHTNALMDVPSTLEHRLSIPNII